MQMAAVVGRTDQEEQVGERSAATTERNAEAVRQRPGRAAPKRSPGGARVQQATPLSSAVGCISSRLRTASAICRDPKASRCGWPPRPSSRWLNCAVRAGEGNQNSFGGQQVEPARARTAAGCPPPASRLRLVGDPLFVGKADLPFQPMMNFRSREPPIAGHAATWQLAALDQPRDLAGIQVQVFRE